MGFLAQNEAGREIFVTSTAGKYVEDSFAEAGYYTDTGDDATDTDLDFINENYSDSLYEEFLERPRSAADWLNDRD